MLTERQIKILEFIVDNFISTGLPTGSRTISKMTLLDVSAATIRNEMADLEDLGYIVQPHISAGRLPSELGIRFHVDQLLQEMDSYSVSSSVSRLLSQRGRITQEILSMAAKLLSDTTKMTAIVTGVGFQRGNMQNLQLVRISDRRVLLVLVGNRENYKTLPLEMEGFTQEELDVLGNLLLECFVGGSEGVDFKKVYDLGRVVPKYRNFIEYLIPILRESLKEMMKEEVFVSGREYLIEAASQKGEEYPIKIMTFLKEPERVLGFLKSDISKVHVRIGQEIGEPLFEGFSLVQGTYGDAQGTFGTIGVIGPIRMDYEKVMAEVTGVQKTLNAMFRGIHL